MGRWADQREQLRLLRAQIEALSADIDRRLASVKASSELAGLKAYLQEKLNAGLRVQPRMSKRDYNFLSDFGAYLPLASLKPRVEAYEVREVLTGCKIAEFTSEDDANAYVAAHNAPLPPPVLE